MNGSRPAVLPHFSLVRGWIAHFVQEQFRFFLSKDALVVCLLTLTAVLAGCDSLELRKTEKGALAGGAIGAGLGAVIGSQTGSTGGGIAIGSAAGAAAGGIIGHVLDSEDEWVSDRSSRLRTQEGNLEENRRLLAALRSGGADVRSTRRGIVVNLPEVFFEFDDASLTTGARAAVRKIAAALRSAPSRTVGLEGHTDSDGTPSYNKALSEQRARTVEKALIHEGVAGRRLRTKGFGETMPIASNDTSEGRRRNRRVEVIIENRN